MTASEPPPPGVQERAASADDQSVQAVGGGTDAAGNPVAASEALPDGGSEAAFRYRNSLEGKGIFVDAAMEPAYFSVTVPVPGDPLDAGAHVLMLRVIGTAVFPYGALVMRTAPSIKVLDAGIFMASNKPSIADLVPFAACQFRRLGPGEAVPPYVVSAKLGDDTITASCHPHMAFLKGPLQDGLPGTKDAATEPGNGSPAR